ncbi:MAG: tetratricopeptide repeat protein [Pseudomonadota bacterium]
MDRLRETDARDLCTKAYELQMIGKLDEAASMYKRSIELHPTAEAHTFLGWTLGFMGRYEEAIAECKRAIKIDPEFGNPWNDIGAYLIELGKEEEAVPYLERATIATRYDGHVFPHYNLSRVFLKKGMLQRAMEELQKALEADPEYLPARQALAEIEIQLQ